MRLGNVVTVADPIEYDLPRTRQLQVQSVIEFAFLYRGSGCQHRRRTGFTGRMEIYGLLEAFAAVGARRPWGGPR